MKYINKIRQKIYVDKICFLNMSTESPKYTSSRYPYIWFKMSPEKSVINSLIFNVLCFPLPCADH